MAIRCLSRQPARAPTGALPAKAGFMDESFAEGFAAD
jgi:hypothetical protein